MPVRSTKLYQTVLNPVLASENARSIPLAKRLVGSLKMDHSVEPSMAPWQDDCYSWIAHQLHIGTHVITFAADIRF